MKKRKRQPERQRQVGAWLPWPVVEKLCRLDLRPPSHRRVFLAVLLTAARYGGAEAYRTVAELTELTGLAPRTVKAALSALVQRDLLIRTARYQRLHVPWLDDPQGGGGADTVAPPEEMPGQSRGADMSAPRRCRHVCTWPTSLYSFLKEERGKGAFSAPQRQLIADVLTEATELLGSDAGQLPLPDHHAAHLGLLPPASYRDALAAVLTTGDRRQAQVLTRAVLDLRNDVRVQGEELLLPEADR